MKKKFRYLVLFTYLVVASALIFFVFQNNFQKENLVLEKNVAKDFVAPQAENNLVQPAKNLQEEVGQEENKKLSATITVDKLILKIEFREGETLYDVLMEENKKGNLHIAGKDFSGMGFFVSEIGSLKETNDEHLIYFVNQKSPSVGISSYLLKDNDVISWQLKK